VVVTTAGRVVAVVADVPDGPGATDEVVDTSTVDEVDELDVDEEELVVVEATVLVLGRTVVVGDWVATCWRGESSVPVATSNRRAAKAMDARA
jgi:hypothetical protein